MTGAFERLARLPDRDLPLVEAALLIAREEYPALDVPACVRGLAGLAPGRLPDVEALNRHFFGTLGFHGNLDDYYDPRNSYLNEVLDRRTGIPITLTTVYVEVARRAGLRAEGIGFPGHFLARCGGALVDCFHGRILCVEDCQGLLDSIYGGGLPFRPEMLQPAGPRETLVRMLTNLKAVYLARGEPARSLRFVEMALALAPDALDLVRERGALRLQLGDPGRALADLERCLGLPGAREQAALARRMLTQSN